LLEVILAEFTLRPATEADFPVIRQLIRESRLNPTGLNWRRFLIAETPEGQFAGCGQIKPHPEGTLELASIAVREPYREHGLASRMIEQLLANEPFRPIYLTCGSELSLFYEKFGFRVLELAEMPVYYRRLSRLVNLFLFIFKRKLLVMALHVERESQ
jgi:N-acetylglutamate synthase-like GNAT family acetyltransferase